MNDAGDLWALPEPLRNLVESELHEREAINWVGQPIHRRFVARSLPIVLFGIPWTAFAIFWMAGAAGFKMPNFQQGFDFFPLFGIPFVLIGFGMLSAPLWIAKKARRTVYVLTDRRAILFDGGWSTTIRSFGPERLTDLRRVQRPDGSGDLIFEKSLSYDSDGDKRSTDIGFLAIPDVKDVEDRVRRIAGTGN